MIQAKYVLARSLGLEHKLFVELLGLVEDDKDKIAVWFSLMDVSHDGYVSEDEFIKLKYIVHSPIIRKPLPHQIRKDSIEDCIFPKLYEFGKKSLYDLCPECLSSCVREVKRDEKGRLRAACVSAFIYILQACSYVNFIIMINFSVMVLPLLEDKFPSAKHQSCHDTRTHIWMVYLIVFGGDMIMSAMGQASKSDWFHHINPWVQTRHPGGHRHFSPELSHTAHLFDILFVIMLIIGIVDLCHDDNGADFDYVVVLSLLRGFKCFAVSMCFEKYAQVVKAVKKCIPAIAPQFNLFIVVSCLVPFCVCH